MLERFKQEYSLQKAQKAFIIDNSLKRLLKKIGSTCIARGWIKNVSGADRDLADQAIQQLQLAFHGRSSHVVNRPALSISFSVKRHSAFHTFKVVRVHGFSWDLSQRAIRKRSSFSPFYCRWPFSYNAKRLPTPYLIISATIRPLVILHHRGSVSCMRCSKSQKNWEEVTRCDFFRAICKGSKWRAILSLVPTGRHAATSMICGDGTTAILE